MVIYIGSRIAKLRPRKFQFLAAHLRDLFIVIASYRWNFKQDGLISKHNFSFQNDSLFIQSKDKVVKALGVDYRIDLRLHQAIWAARNGLRLKTKSKLVELGTGKGYLMRTTIHYLESLGYRENFEVLLFDTFLPYSLSPDGAQTPASPINPVYAHSFDSVKKLFESSNVRLIPGTLPDSLIGVDLKDISFLHIDLNNPHVEVDCLEKLWPYLIPNAIILIDDYSYVGNEETLRVFNNFALSKERPILTLASGQGILIK